MTARDIYEQYIRSLPATERLRLLALMARELASQTSTPGQPTRGIMELHGLGKEIWVGVDAQDYVENLRSEWDHGHFPDET